MTEAPTPYPAFLKRLQMNLPGVVAGMEWSPAAKFVDDGAAFRLYEIEGTVSSAPEDLAEKLSGLYGEGEQEQLAHVWKKHGTTIRLLEAGGDPLLQFTDDALADMATEKMAKAMDSGDYTR